MGGRTRVWIFCWGTLLRFLAAAAGAGGGVWHCHRLEAASTHSGRGRGVGVRPAAQGAAAWGEKDCASMEVLLNEKERVRLATRAYLDSLSDAELNRTLIARPREWVRELKSPAFILLHVVTHTFHHKGQVVAMLRTLGYPAPDTDLQRG